MREGLFAAVLRWLGYAFLIIAGLIFVMNLANIRTMADAVINAMMIGIFSIPLLAVAWIIDGFAKRE